MLLALGLGACNPQSKTIENSRTGSYSGLFEYGNFSDQILFEVEQDSANWSVFFTSLEQNANRIPFQDVEVWGDSISFKLQSDFYTYTFKNRWIDNDTRLEGSLTVDTLTASYTLAKELSEHQSLIKSEEVGFESNGLELKGTIWYPQHSNNRGLVIVSSSGNADRSASRAEAILFAQRGYTTFHYDKRGTGNSQGDWTAATIEELALDDINAIQYFSSATAIPLAGIGIKGSSQGATKVPCILNELNALKYGIVVSCPGTTLLESDLNYWKNGNVSAIGEDLESALSLQRMVFRYIAGELTRADLEAALAVNKSESWFSYIWIPDLDDVKTDKKLLYSPIPHFEKTTQPLLIIQGTSDEIIPDNSYEIISTALIKADNRSYKVVLLEGASHSMHNVGESDFPYWSKLHPDYINSIENWIDLLPGRP
jgi:dipeptidyl aminopeptidase/acylaminoacyl peptidase